MLLKLTEEQHLIDASVAEVLSEQYTFTQRTRSFASKQGVNPVVWHQFAELGWLGLNVSEPCGGLGLGLLESGLLMEKLGRYLVIEPVWTSVILATQVLQTCAPARIDLLEKLVSGQVRAALVYQGITKIDASGSPIVATHHSGGYELNGSLQICPGAPSADYLIVLAALNQDGASRPALFIVHQQATGVKLENYQMLDGSRAASVYLEHVKLSTSDLLADRSTVQTEVDQVVAQAMLLLCWEAMGSMTAAFEQTREYLGTRMQFGKTLNSFQVVQHRLAEMAVLCREARAICELGVIQAGIASVDMVDIAVRVKAKVGQCAQLVSKDCVQLHGAMGVTEELPIASHFRKLLWFQTIWALSEKLAQRAGACLLSEDKFQSAVLPVMPEIAITAL